jgi:hypothetical protein
MDLKSFEKATSSLASSLEAFLIDRRNELSPSQQRYAPIWFAQKRTNVAITGETVNPSRVLKESVKSLKINE